MKKTFVRLISAVLSAAMTLTAVPLSAFAEGETHTHDGDSNVITAPLDFREKKADESSNGWSWDYDTKTLTFDGVNIQATLPDSDGDIHSVVTVPDGTEIVLKGENTIIQTGSVEYTSYALGAVNTDATNCDGTMTISGDGVLNAENRSTDSMARSLGGTIILNGGTVNATGKVVAESLEIHNDGVLNANATTASFDGAAVGVGGSITVDGNGKLTAIGCAIENENIMNSAIWLNGNQDSKISVTGNGSITVPESNGARYGICYNVDRRRINAEISGGNVTAYGTLCGISGINLIMSGTGSVYATGGVLSIDNTDPKIDENEFVVKGSTEFKAEESAVTDDAEYVNSWYCIGEENAKTVVIKPDTSPRIILGKQTGIFKTEEYKIIEDIDMTDIKLKGTVYFDITLKNMSDEEFADARGYFGGDEPDLSASIIKTDYGWVCMVCDTEFSTTYDTDNTLTIKCGDIVSNTVQVKSNANRFNKVTQGDNTNRTVFYTNTSQEEKDNYKLVSTYTVDSESISYNWYSTNSAYSADELGAAVSGTGGEFKLADNIPARNYVLYCDITYSDGGSTETVTEKFTFTYKECAHENGYSDGKCTDCGALCDHSDINTDTGKCSICGKVCGAIVIKADGTAVGYDDLAAAFAEAGNNNGRTLKLFSDYDLSEDINVSGEFTIDLNKKYIHCLNSSKIIIGKNATISLTGNAGSNISKLRVTGGTLTVLADCSVLLDAITVQEGKLNLYSGRVESLHIEAGADIALYGGYISGVFNDTDDTENPILLRSLLADGYAFATEDDNGAITVTDVYDSTISVYESINLYVVEHKTCSYDKDNPTGKCKECGKPCEHSGDINTDTGICSICGAIVSVAIYTDANGISKYVDADELHSLLNEYNGSGTVKLFKDYDNPNAKYDLYGELTIDVNGHELNIRSITPCKNGKLTIKNSGDQVIFGCNAYPTSDASYAGGTLIIDGDIILDTAIYVYDSSTVILNAGTYPAGLTARDSKTLYDMLGEGKAFFKTDGTLFNASVKEISSSVTLTVKDHSHTYVDGKCDCGYVCTHSNIDIDTGKCTECEYQYAAVIVKDGAVASVYKETEMVAAFEAADSDANTGCTLKVYKNYAGSYTTLSGKFTLWIAEKANVGTLTVSGDITVTGSGKNNSIFGDFNVAAGGKLTFDENCGATGIVSVGAGTFDCYYSIDITLNINDASSDVILHDGTFRKICYNGGGDRANAEILTLLAENRMFMKRYGEPIDGSKTLLKDGFATIVIVIPHEGHGYDSTTGKCTICGKRCGHTDVDSKTGVCPTCKYQLTAGISGVGTAKYFDNIDDAFTAALSEVNSGCTLTLYKDCELSQNIVIGNATVTVDMNGHSILLAYRIKVNDGGVLYLKNSGENGSIETEIDVNKGGTLINGTADDSRSAVSVFGVTADAAKRVEIYGGSYEGLTVNNGTSGIALYGGSYESINTNDLTDSTPVSALLAKGYAFATLNSVTHLPESIVDGSETNLNPGLENVMVVAHTHTYTETNAKCACGAVLYAKVTSADGTSNKYFDSIEEGLLYADKAENKGCVFTLVTTGGLENDITLSSGQFTITAIDGNYINAYTRKINIKGAEITVENCAFNCFVGLYSGSLTYPEGSTSVCINGISVFGGTLNISDGVSENFGANKFTISDTATDAKVTIGGGIYSEIKLGQYTFKDILASGTRLISVEYSQETDEIIATNELLYSIVSEQNTLGVDDDKDYRFVKCDHKNEDGSYAFNEGGICKYCNSEFAASVSYTDGGEKTELFGDIIDAFDKANDIGTATVTLYKNIENSEFTREITVTGNVTLNLNGKTLGGAGGTNMQVSDGGTLTVDGDGDLQMFINVNENSKSVINGGELTYVRVYEEGNAEIKGGVINYLEIYGNAKISGGKFNIIKTANGSLESVLADGYAYRIDGGEWLSIAERAEDVYNSSDNDGRPVNVEKAPIESASIAWAGGEAPVIYRNGYKYLNVNVTRKLADDSKKITHLDFVNGNSMRKTYTLNGSGYTAYAYDIGEVIAKDGEVEYYTVLKCDGYEYKSNVLKFTIATCSHPEDSFTEKDNDGSVYCGICDLRIEAQVIAADGEPLGYAGLNSAIKLAQANEGSTVKLISARIPSSITVTGGKFTVDFNGKDTYYQFYVNGGDVTFTSSAVQDVSRQDLLSEIEVNGTDAKVTIDGKIKLGSVTLSSGTLTVNSTQGYIKELSIIGGNAVIDDAIIGALQTNGGDTVINCVEADSLSMNFNGSGSISIVTGTFGSTTCERDSGYTLGMAIASGSAVSADSMNGITVYTYDAIQTMTSTYRIFVDKCVHKGEKGSYVLDGNPCPYCNEEIVATVSYTADGSEQTDLFTDIYDAFERANEIGTATVTLYKDIESSITETIAVTGNVTLELNDKKLSTPGFDPFYAIEVKSGKLTVNGSGTIKRAVVRNGGDAEINGGTFSDFRIEDGGNAVINGGKFNSIKVSGEGRNVGQLLADGYAYKNFDGFWSTVAEREKQGIANVNVLEAPIKSASIAWADEEAPVIYRNGYKYLNVKVTRKLADDSKKITHLDFVNGNSMRKTYTLNGSGYTAYAYDIGEVIAKDGEVEYYTVLKCDGYEYKSNALKFTLATCSHPEDSFTEKDNDGSVYCGICDLRMDAQVIAADGESLGYAGLNSAIKLAQANEGSTVKLISERVPSSITVTGGKFTVDFNGKKVYYQFYVNGGDVTFTSSAVQDDNRQDLLSKITVDGTDAKVTIDGKIKPGSVTLTSGTLTVNSADGYIGELSIEGGKADIDGAEIDTLVFKGGDLAIRNVTVGSLDINKKATDATEHNIVIESGSFDTITCSDDSDYNIVKALASERRLRGTESGIIYEYSEIESLTEATEITVEKCDHKYANGNIAVDDDYVCYYCKSQIVATVSYTADGSEQTDLFSDIYDAFAKANEAGTATITLYKDIESNITETIAVTGNVTLELNGKKLSTSGFDPFYAIEVKSGKLTVNGSGTIKRAVVRNGGDAEINGGTFSDFRIEDGGNAVINGGKFNSIKVSGEGRNVGQLLADGYAYKNFDGFWSTVAEREKQGIASVNVLEAPIKSASIAWAGEGTPVVYRNGVKYLDVNVTYDVADTSKQITYSDFVNGNNRIKDSELSGNWYAVFGYEIGDIITKDGEVEYYTVLKCDGYEYKSNVLKLTLATCSHPEDRFTEKDSNGWVYCSICDLRIDAQVIAADGEMLGYADIESAIELAQENEGSTVKLISERVPVSVTVTGGKFTVDFNGKEVYYNFDVNGGDVTFTSSTEQADADYLPSGIKVNGTNAKVTIDGKIKLGIVRTLSGTLTINSTDSYIETLSIEGAKTDIDGARIGALKTFGGEAVIKNVTADSLAMCDNRSGGSEYNISIVSGRFGSFTCETDSGYTIGKVMASGSSVQEEGEPCYYDSVKNRTGGTDLVFSVCDHKNNMGRPNLNDANVCNYCNSQIVATVSYTADGSEKTDLFGDICDAFAKANEAGTATITLYKDIADSELTRDVNVTGNVTLALNGKKLGDSYDGKYIQSSDGGELTVNGDGKIAKTVRAKKNSKLTINSGEFDWVIIDEGGDAVISGGSIAAVNINGNAELSGGKFYIIAVYGTLESMLADGYAYKIDGGAWLSIADRARSGYSNVDHEHKPVTVEEAPIKSATITAEDESPIIYRNGRKTASFTADVTYSGNETLYVTGYLIDGTVIKEKTELLGNRYYLFSGEVDKAVAEDGEIQYYCIFTYDGYEYKSNAVTLTVATCRHLSESVKCDDNGNYVCGICDSTLLASVELSDGTLSYYNNRNDAIGAAEDSEGCTLKLLSYSWLNYNETFDISKGRFTVDFNKDDGSGRFTFNVKGGDITFTTSQATSNPWARVQVSGENANVLIDSKARLNGLVVNSGKVTVDGANIGAITINGGDMVINDVDTGLLSEEGNGSVNISIVSGRFESVVFDEYTFGKAIASGSRIRLTDADGGKIYKYAEIQNKGNAGVIVVEKCDHKDENDSYALDGKPCPYCNEEIAATVSYTADGSEQTDLFSDIYDAFAKANEVGTATVTLYKDIENSEFTRYITVTGNVTLALNGKKLGYSFVSLTVEVSDGGMLTVDGDGKMMVPIIVNENAKLTVNGGEIATVMIYKDGDAVIGGGFIEDLDVNGNVKLSGGKFDNIEIANGSLESILADGYAYKKDGGAWLSIAERAKEKYYSWNNEDKPVTVEEAPIKSATLSTKINKLYRNSNANPTLKFILALAVDPNQNDSDVRMRYGINSYECGDTVYSSLRPLLSDTKLLADKIIDKAGDSDAAEIYYVVTTGDGYEIKSNTVSIDLVDCDHSQVVDPTADKEIAGNITEPTYCEICESKFNAKITKGDDVKYYDDLDDAAKDAQKSENEGCTLYPLYNKKGYVGQFVITEGNFTLKYAVRTAFANPVVIKGNAKLKVTGRCAVTSSENPDAFFVDGGDVTFDGLATGSNVTINGGNVTMSGNNINRLTINGGNVSISSGGFAEIVTTVSDKVIADYIDPGFWVQDRGTKEWIDIYSLDKATASSTNVLSVRLCPMQIIKPIDTVYYTNGYYPGGIPSLQINAEPWYSDEVNAKVAYQWIAIDENGNETVIEGATDRKLSLENLTTGRYYCRLTYSNAATAGVSMKSDVVTATITECEHSGGKATCTNKAKCEICGADYGKMLPHSYAHIKAPEYLKSAATCTAKAVYYTSCTECGQSSKGTADEETFEYGNALGHKYGEWVSNGDGTHTRVCANDNKHTETKACHGGKATCTAKAICEVCGKAYGEMTAHTFTKTVSEKYLKSAATCTTKAVYYTSCAECGQSSKGTKDEATFEYGNALGHKYGAWVSNGDGTHTRVCANDSTHTETKDCHGGKATCTAKAICEVCGKAYGEMTAHTFTKTASAKYLKSAATCTTKAVYYTSCADCGQSSKGTKNEATFEYGNALGHKYGEWISNGDGTHTRVCANDSKHTETKACHGGKATCTAKAICEDCGAEYGEMTAHTFTAKSAVSRYLKKAATCTEKSVYYVSCAGCGLSSKGTASEATFEGSALGHLLTQWNVTDASCTENGSEERHCTRCDYKQTHIIPAKGHTFGEWKITKNVGCVTDGEQTRECTICGSKETKVIAATGVHVYGEWKVTKAPTCTAAGVKVRTCTGCNAKETMTLQAIGHKYIASTVKPTYSAKGYTLYKCSLCGKSYKSNYTNMLVLPSVSGLKATSKTDKSITLGWNRNANAAGYVIEYYNGAKWVKKSTVTKNTTVKYTVSSLKPGTVNKFRIRAYNATNYSAYSYITVNTLPSAVSGFKTVSKTSSTSTLSWNKNTSADGYIIDRYIGNRWMQTLKVVGSGNVSATVKNLTAGSTNKLRIRAYKTINKKTEYSSYTYLNVKTKPAQMTGLKVKSKTNNTVTLQWNKNTTADSVFIEKYDGSKWVNVKKLSAGYTAYTVNGLSSGRTYRFRVRAYRAGEYSGYTYLNVNTRPYTTTGMKSKSVTKNSIVLQWNKNTSADGYSIEKYDGKKWVQVKRYTSNKSTTYTIKSLKAGTTYKFRMRAYKTIGNVNEYSAYTYCNVTTAK